MRGGTVRTVLVGTGVLIAVYLLVSNATDAGRLLASGGSVYVQGVRVLQGR